LDENSFEVTKIIRAPLKFVFEWCTDFREDDAEILGSNNKIQIAEKNESQVIRLVESDTKFGVIKNRQVITLNPPNKWHVERVGDEANISGDYELTESNSHTNLKMNFRHEYNMPEFVQTTEKRRERFGMMWDNIIKALENDYSK